MKPETKKFLGGMIGIVLVMSPVFYGLWWKKKNDLQVALYQAVLNQDRKEIARLVSIGADLNKKPGYSLDEFSCHLGFGSNPNSGKIDLGKLYEAHSQCLDSWKKNQGNGILYAHIGFLNSLDKKVKKDGFIKFLRSLGAEDNFYSAAATNNHQVLKKELSNREIINKQSGVIGTALSIAAVWGNIETLNFLLKNGADIDIEEEMLSFQTPLNIAINFYREDVAIFLLKSGANPRGKPSTSLSPLRYACINGLTRVIPVLVEKGLSLKGNIGAECIYTASSINRARKYLEGLPGQNKYLELIDIVVSLGGSPNFPGRTQNKDYPIHIAASLGNDGVIKKLIETGADLNVQDALKQTPLAKLCASDRIEYKNVPERLKILELLVAAGSDLNSKDSDGLTPLDHAIKNKHLELVTALKKKGAKSGKDL